MSLNRGLVRISRLDKTWENRPNIYISVFAAIAIFTFLIRLISDFIWGSYLSVVIQAILIVVTTGIYFLNEAGWHGSAKIALVMLINCIVFVYCNVAPKDLGIYFYFGPAIGVASLVFREEEQGIRNMFFLLPIMLIGVLIISDFQLFGKININDGIEDTTSSSVNLLISHLVLVFVLLTMNRLTNELEKKRRMSADELAIKSRNLEKTNHELIHFSYRTSHDLKAPLTSILGLINIARYDVKDPNALVLFSKIEERVRNLIFFVRDILYLSKNAHAEVRSQELQLQSMIVDAIENVRQSLDTKSIEFNQDIQTQGMVIGDRARFQIILNNLLSNAVKYQKPNAEVQRIAIAVRHNPDRLILTIRDNGIGIPKEYQDKIFEMFYRANENSDGSGLGLYIVSDIVSKLNGTITIDSKEGEGTTVTVWLPLKKHRQQFNFEASLHEQARKVS